MNKYISPILGLVGGSIIGALFSLLGRSAANAAVSVRPNLADVGFIQAFLTQHPIDWLFYNYTTGMTVVVVSILGFIGLLVGYMYEL